MATSFHVPDRIETAYRASISKLIDRRVSGDFTSVSEWLQQFYSKESKAELTNLSASIARNMVKEVAVKNAKSWREAAFKAQGGNRVHKLLQQELSGLTGFRYRAIIEQNAKLISGIPAEVAQRLSHEVDEAQLSGARPETIAKLLRRRLPELTTGRIKLIARTEPQRCSAALTRARSEDLGIICFIWKNSQDRRVRPSHRIMENVVVFYNDLPSPEALIGQKPQLGYYMAGDCPNCRCTSLPVLTIQDVFRKGVNLAKVYRHGKIHQMTRAQFIKLSGIESRMAA
jgi:SPP1 gp7 family putative phage head morphogenesis protein